jgi:hypothetical protein
LSLISTSCLCGIAGLETTAVNVGCHVDDSRDGLRVIVGRDGRDVVVGPDGRHAVVGLVAVVHFDVGQHPVVHIGRCRCRDGK